MAHPAAIDGTRRRAGLDRADVVAAALTLVEERGADELTMRKLASELGVTTTTIYWHVGGRDELVIAVIKRLSADLAAQPVEGTTPRERVLSVTRLVWNSALAHRNVTALAHQIGATSLLELPLEVALAEELVGAGLHGEGARDALRGILMCVAGFLVVALRRDDRIPREYRDLALWADVDADVDPQTRAALCQPPDLSALFETTIEAVVDSFVPASPIPEEIHDK